MSSNAPQGRPLRLLPAPPTDPPYDDELGGAAPVVDGALALAFPMPATSVPLRLAPPAIEEATDEDTERATPRALLPDPVPLARRLAQVVVEVVAGDRPASQLARHATLDVLDQLERTARHRAARAAATQRAQGVGANAPVAARPQVTSVHVSEPTDGVAEACAVVSAGPRRRALAFRLEGLDGRWQCTALRMG